MYNQPSSLRVFRDLLNSWARTDSLSKDLRDFGRSKKELRLVFFIFLLFSILFYIINANFRIKEEGVTYIPLFIHIFIVILCPLSYKVTINLLVKAGPDVDQRDGVRNSLYFFIAINVFLYSLLSSAVIISYFIGSHSREYGVLFLDVSHIVIFIFILWRHSENTNIVFGLSNRKKSVVVSFASYIISFFLVFLLLGSVVFIVYALTKPN
ncbi:MAG: hypothetical protein LCH38_10160 [Proteobacteria bacterium]|nr:hypothetical protein [Pseudomonadota bacterium]